MNTIDRQIDRQIHSVKTHHINIYQVQQQMAGIK